ncbi:MAG TPA: hypothetical protein H9671_03675 [Firmicutes bacterium]|nr:hypothetical protein [Bacillota bacterium]
MRGNEFLDKMELIDPAYVEAADAKPNRKKYSWIKWGAVAACFAVMVLAGTRLLLQDESGLNSDLPMLSISENTSAMGYEGYMAYDISELVNANPWNEDSKISTLPVYQNSLTYDANFIASGADFDKMQAFILDVAGRLGLDTNSLLITDNAPDRESQQKIIEKFQSVGCPVPDGYFAPTKLIIEADGVEIEVDQTMTAKVSFDPPISLPEKYNFTHHAAYDDKVAVADYLKSEYCELIGLDDPQVNIYGGDYNIYNQQSYSIEFFDAGESDVEQIINYNFNRVAFYCDDNGELFIARIYQPNLSKKLGDYPIISSEQAKELLLNGNYITTVPYAISGAEFIKKVELIYRTGKYEEYYMPYYCFYVELPEEERENGLKTYGAYYVPAVESSYISNMPTWDGSFNY